MKKITLDVTGMHCASCATLITKRLEKEPGVSYANVNLTTEKATAEFDETKVSDKRIISTIESLGYKAKIIEGNKASQDYESKKREASLKHARNLFLFSLVFAIPAFLAAEWLRKIVLCSLLSKDIVKTSLPTRIISYKPGIIVWLLSNTSTACPSSSRVETM